MSLRLPPNGTASASMSEAESIDDDSDGPARPRSDSSSASLALTVRAHRLDTAAQTSRAGTLPFEILINVFRFLPVSALIPLLTVCRAWCECIVELVWLKISVTDRTMLDHVTALLAADGKTSFGYRHYIRRLNLSNVAEFVDDRILELFAQCPNIERATFINCKGLNAHALVNAFSGFRNMVSVDLTNVENVDDSVLIAIANHAPRLQGINFCGCTRITDRGISAIALSCPNLRRVKLRQITNITDISIVMISQSCPHIIELDLVGCSLTSISLQQVFRYSTCIRELSLINCSQLTDAAFPSAYPAIPAAAVVLSTPKHLVPKPMSEWVEDLAAQRDADEGAPLEVIGETTTISYGPPLEASDSDLLPRPPPLDLALPIEMRSLEQIRFLDLTNLPQITDEAVRGIVKHMPRLRNLVLAKCPLLTDDALASICSLGKYLHYLHLGHVSQITDSAVTQLARACTRLRYIDLANCTNLTDLSVFELSEHLPRLKRIGLVRVNHITDQAIFALFKRPSLERVHLSYCDQISERVIYELLTHLRKITHLSLTGVPAFRRQDLQQFCRSPPADFNEHQREAFCVFSGVGIERLRQHLETLHASGTGAIPDSGPLYNSAFGPLGGDLQPIPYRGFDHGPDETARMLMAQGGFFTYGGNGLMPNTHLLARHQDRFPGVALPHFPPIARPQEPPQLDPAHADEPFNRLPHHIRVPQTQQQQQPLWQFFDQHQPHQAHPPPQ